MSHLPLSLSLPLLGTQRLAITVPIDHVLLVLDSRGGGH